MKSNAHSFYSLFNKKLALLTLLLLVFGLSTTVMAQQAVKYKITTWTGAKNGCDKPVSIIMSGTLSTMDEAIQLDNPGVDDFIRGAKDEFIVDSRDLGIITDIKLKAHKDDYWKADRIQITKLGKDVDGKPFFTSDWNGNFPELINGNFPKKFVRASNIPAPKTRLGGLKDVIIRREALPCDNLNNKDGNDKCLSYSRPVTISEGYSTESSSSTSFTNTFGASITAIVPEVLEVTASYTFEVATSMSEAFSKSQGSDLGTDVAPEVCARPGTIKYELLQYVETRQYGEVSYLGGKETIYKVIDAAWVPYGEMERTYQEVDAYFANPSADPELAEAIGLTRGQTPPNPRSKSLPAISFGGAGNPTVQEKPNSTIDKGSDTGATTTTINNTSTVETTTSNTTMQVSKVEFSNGAGDTQGYFQKVEEGTKSWVETDAEGHVRFRYQELKQEGEIIFLYDKGRKVTICLDLNGLKVLYSDQNNTEAFPIYDISDAY